MTEATTTKLQGFLEKYAERHSKAPAAKAADGAAERKRRACAEALRHTVRPVLDEFMTALKSAGHEASTRDHTERNDSYPSVALSFTPRTQADASPEVALASALIFRYDPRHGILVQRDVKPSPSRGTVVTSSGARTGTIGVDTVSTQWVETKTLAFVEDVLKAN